MLGNRSSGGSSLEKMPEEGCCPGQLFPAKARCCPGKQFHRGNLVFSGLLGSRRHAFQHFLSLSVNFFDQAGIGRILHYIHRPHILKENKKAEQDTDTAQNNTHNGLRL